MRGLLQEFEHTATVLKKVVKILEKDDLADRVAERKLKELDAKEQQMIRDRNAEKERAILELKDLTWDVEEQRRTLSK